MNIAQAIMKMYPDANPLENFVVRDNSDGMGAYIDQNQWKLPYAIPSTEELQSYWIESLKDEKINEINANCENTILAGFTSSSTGYSYDFTNYDQMNITQQMLLLVSDPTIASIQWKTQDAGIVSLTRDQFLQIANEANDHKRVNIGKYWTLKSQVQSATMEDEINAIVW